MDERQEPELPTNNTIIKIIRMLKSIKPKSTKPSPAKPLEIISDASEAVEPLDSPYPVPNGAFVYETEKDPKLYLSQPIQTPQPEGEEQLAQSELGGTRARVTLNNFLTKDNRKMQRVSLLARNKEPPEKSLRPSIHYSNLNINMSNNKTNFFNSTSQYAHANRSPGMVMGNFQSPIGHYVGVPGFNLINSPRGIYSGAQPKPAFEPELEKSESAGQICSEHQSKAQLVCLTDRKVICTNCALFGVHKGHHYMKFEEFVTDCRAKVKLVAAAAKKGGFEEFLSEKQRCLREFEKTVEAKKKKMFQQIERVLQGIVASLKSQERETKREVAKQFEQFGAWTRELAELGAESKARGQDLRSKIDKLEMTLDSKVPDLGFLLENLGSAQGLKEFSELESLLQKFQKKEKRILGGARKKLGIFRIEASESLLQELKGKFVKLYFSDQEGLRRLGTHQSQAKTSASALMPLNPQKLAKKRNSATQHNKLMKNSVNFSLEKEFEDFHFNLELNKRLNQASKQSIKSHLDAESHCASRGNFKAPPKIEIYTDSGTSGGSEAGAGADFDPVNMMGACPSDSQGALDCLDSDELLNDSPEKRRHVSKAENFAEARTEIRKSQTKTNARAKKKSMKFLQDMKNKTRNFELMVSLRDGNKLKRAAKQHKSHKHFNPKLRELINFSENLVFEKEKYNSGRKAPQAKNSTLRGSGMLAGYLSDRKIQDKTFISQFNDFAQSRNLELSRKVSVLDLSKHKFSR